MLRSRRYRRIHLEPGEVMLTGTDLEGFYKEKRGEMEEILRESPAAQERMRLPIERRKVMIEEIIKDEGIRQ